MWSTPIDLYCERTTAAFWAEPVNAISNFAFLIAALAAFMAWRKDGKGDAAILALIVAATAVGLGSFTFHTLATRGAMLLDVVPIGIFMYGYFLLALRRFLKLSWMLSVVGVLAFMSSSIGLASVVPRAVLNGSSGYFPSLAALFCLGLIIREHPVGKTLLHASALFAVAIAFRIVDLDLCPALPLGTHFLWHICNGGVIYLALRAALVERQQPLQFG